jgi:hypothetical protein
MNDRVLGVGLSSAGLKTIGYTAATTQMAAAGGVLGGIVGALAGGDTKSAGIGGAVGAVLGGIFGAFGAYEAGQGVTQ